jgi:hypothetical protein
VFFSSGADMTVLIKEQALVLHHGYLCWYFHIHPGLLFLLDGMELDGQTEVHVVWSGSKA